MKISLLIKMKMPTIVGIFIFISREKFIVSRDELEEKLYNPGAQLTYIPFPKVSPCLNISCRVSVL